MDYENFIIEKIKELSGRYAPYQIFTDWVSMTALSIQNSCVLIHNKIYNEREKTYLNIAQKYSEQELKTFAHMSGALTLIFEDRFCDFLGEIYMKAGCGSKNTGQFFTPYHLSYLTARLAYENQFDRLRKNDVIEINEPSVGGGGMMIAVCQLMKEKGINYQRKLHIIAQDLDWNGVYMTYIQLSLLGVKATVVQGNTLCKPYRKGYDEKRVFRTPAEMGMLL